MALTKDERNVLRLTRHRVATASDGCGYVCNHINFVVIDNPALEKAGMRLLRYVASSLKGHGTLESWQRANNRRSVSRGHIADRLEWIDWMMGL